MSLYWKGLEFVKREDDASKLGVTWTELAIDSELATRVMLNGEKWERRRSNNGNRRTERGTVRSPRERSTLLQPREGYSLSVAGRPSPKQRL